MADRVGADFSVGFRNEASLTQATEAELYAEADRRIRALAQGHTDLIDASISVEELTGDETPHLFEVTVVLYMRPDQTVAVEKDETAVGAMKGALDAAERQVRETRAKRRETWKPR